MNSRIPEFASLHGRTAVVTGASSGIGKAIALEFARAGANLVVHYAKSKDSATEVARIAQSWGVQATTAQADFSAGTCEGFAQEMWSQAGPIEIWVNNAGVDLLTGVGASWSYVEKLAALLQIDVSTTVQCSREVGRLMQSQGTGCIVNIGWDQADRGMGGESAELFSVAKNAIMGFTRSLAVSLAPEVRVNCIAPGWIQTEWGFQASDEWQTRVLRETPLQRWGRPEDIARLARFLVSTDADYITGQVINANGGAIR